jgi:hypothetical protein
VQEEEKKPDSKKASAKKPSSNPGTRSATGAGRDTRVIDMDAVIDRIANLDPRQRHLTGPLYRDKNGTVFDPSQILNKNDFFFEPALIMPFPVNDCMPYTINQFYRHPIFTTRDQVHRLALLRQKKSKERIVDRKIDDGYSLQLFDHFVVKNRRKYSLKHEETIITDGDDEAWSRLQDFVQYRMLEVNVNDEFLIIGTFVDEEGKERRHASTFIRLEVGPSKTPVIIHLDCNLMYPQCSKPKLYTARRTTKLDWVDQFCRYYKIHIYGLEEDFIFDDLEVYERIRFAKEVIEGRPQRESADKDEVHEEMSQRGKLGRDAATRSRKDLSQRPKKSQPSQSSQPSQQ